MNTGAVTVIALFSAVAVLTVAAAAQPRWRRQLPKIIGLAAGGVLAAFLVGRGAAEFFIVHYGDPASYRNAWGGPSLAGVFAVHSGPAVAILLGAGGYLVRRHRARRGLSGRVTSVASRRAAPRRAAPRRAAPRRAAPRPAASASASGGSASGSRPRPAASRPAAHVRLRSGRHVRPGHVRLRPLRPSGSGNSGPGPSGTDAARDVRPLARTGGHR